MNQHQPPLFTDLPVEILIDIFSRLSVKSIFICRSFCKLFHSILKSSDFAKLHLSRASPSTVLLVEPNSEGTAYTALHLIEFQRDRHCLFCGNSNSGICGSNRKYKDHVDMELSTKFMLPCVKSRIHRYISVVNSCNGLLCLWSSLSDKPYKPVRGNRAKENEVIAISNPVTSEYSVIPLPEVDDFTMIRSIRVLGLGFCRETGQYKVLIMVHKWTTGNNRFYPTFSVPMIYTLGSSGLWRSVENVPDKGGRRLYYPVFFNSSLHWCDGGLLICFDMNDEKFHVLPPPPPLVKKQIVPPLVKAPFDWTRPKSFEELLSEAFEIFNFSGSVRVLRDRLCVSVYSFCQPCDDTQWVMGKYGIEESWVPEQLWPISSSFTPIDYLNNGDLLMYGYIFDALATYDGNDYRYFKICGSSPKFSKVLFHVPSFVSLQEIVGANTEVVSVKSRLRGCRGKGRKAEPLCLVEHDANMWELDHCDPITLDYFIGKYSLRY